MGDGRKEGKRRRESHWVMGRHLEHSWLPTMLAVSEPNDHSTLKCLKIICISQNQRNSIFLALRGKPSPVLWLITVPLSSDTFYYIFLMLYNEGTWPSSDQQNVMREPLGRFAISHPSVSTNPVDIKIHRCSIPYIKQHTKMCQVNIAQTTIAGERMRIFENGWRLQQGMPTHHFIHMDLV